MYIVYTLYIHCIYIIIYINGNGNILVGQPSALLNFLQLPQAKLPGFPTIRKWVNWMRDMPAGPCRVARLNPQPFPK